MKILITGHKGLIGQELYNRLKLYHDVTGWDRDEEREQWQNFGSTARILDQHYDLIIHAAANCIIRETIKNPQQSKENIDLTFRIMECARNYDCKKVVIFSSGRVTHSEKNPYIASKLYAENMALAYFDCYGIEYMIIRPETVFGLNDHKERVIPAWIRAALKNEPIIVYGDKFKMLPPIHVEDFVDVVIDYLKSWELYKNDIHKINGVPLSADSIIYLIKDLAHSTSEVKFMDPEKTQPQIVDPGNSFGDERTFIRRIEEVVKHGNFAKNN